MLTWFLVSFSIPAFALFSRLPSYLVFHHVLYLALSVAFSIFALSSSWIAFLCFEFCSFLLHHFYWESCFLRYSLFSMALPSFSFLSRMFYRVLFCPCFIRLCMFSLFLFIMAVGNPVSMYKHSLGVDCGVFRILLRILSNICLLFFSFFFIYFSTVGHYWHYVSGYCFPYDFHFSLIECCAICSCEYPLISCFCFSFNHFQVVIRLTLWINICPRYLYLSATSSSMLSRVPVLLVFLLALFILLFLVSQTLCGIFW